MNTINSHFITFCKFLVFFFFSITVQSFLINQTQPCFNKLHGKNGIETKQWHKTKLKKKAKSKKHPSIYNKTNKLSRNIPVNHFNQNKTDYVHIIYWSPNSISRHTIYNPQWEIAKFDQNHNDLQQYQKTFNCIIVLQFVEKIKFFEHDKLIIANTT